jgi:hypothetical protein
VRFAVPLVRADVPLASLLVSQTKPVLAVLPLMWNQYRDLGRANFKLVCKGSQHQGIELHSHSTKPNSVLLSTTRPEVGRSCRQRVSLLVWAALATWVPVDVLRGRKVTVNAVTPGPIATDLFLTV